MGVPPNQLYTVFSFVGFVVSFIPLYWHLEAWNVGTCLNMIWTGLGCLIQCINSIVWNNNMIDKAPVYCDIAIRIQIGLNVAISACSLCINRRLYKIATAKVAVITATEKRRAMLIDLLIGLGIPILQIIVAYVVSGRRYIIFEDFGPYIFIVNTPPAYYLFHAWPVAIGCVSFVYSCETIYILYKRSRQFRQLLSFGQGINRGRYFRLMVFSSVDAFGSIPLATYVLVSDVKSGVVPWKSWAYTHRHYSDIIQIPASEWKNGPDAIWLEMFRWVIVACAFVFFAFFGFGDEAFKHYRLAYTSIARRIGYSKSSGTLHDSSHGYAVRMY
ncbi:GPCR fungal pheromone mating factor [Russula dissimulans]|nr:GPCR fungal pheromone mating factor [Russula dissimulans]